MTDVESPPPPPPSNPRQLAGRLLGVALAVAFVALPVDWAESGSISWRLVGTIGLIWGVRSFVTGLFDDVLEPLGRFAGGVFAGSGPEIPGTRFTIDEETTKLETMMERTLPAHREILVGIRLAEIYRTHQHDPGKGEQLLSRLRAKYPDASELRYAEPD